MSHPSTRRSARSTGDGAGAGASPNLPGSGVPPASMSSGHGNGGGGGGSNSLPVGGGAGDGGGSHRSSPASHMSAASGSSNTSRGSRVTSSRRGRGLRGRSVSPPPVTGSGAASMASPIASSSRHTSPHASPRFSPHSVSSQSRAAAGASSAAAAAAPAAASAASVASANVSVKSALTAATEDVFMSKFVSDPTGETDDAMSKRSLKSNAPSVTASVMLNAIDPSRAASHDCDDTTAFDDGTLTLDGFAVADDSSTLLGDDSSAIDELVQVSSRDSTTFGSRAAPVAAGAAAVAATTAAAATAQPKSTRSMASSIKTRKIKNKHNVTVIGVPSPPPSDSSAAFSATTAGALNGDAASSKVTESTESGHVTPSSPSKLLAPVASTDSDRDGDPSLGAVSSATAASAAARSVLSAQSSRSVRTAQSRVPDIDLNADEGSLNTNMTSATELNRRLKASIHKGKSSKMENIIGVLGEDDPLSKALRDAEDRGVGDVVLASGTAEATAVGKAQTSARSIKSMLSRKSSGSASKRKEANPSPAPVDAAATHPSRPPEQDKDASRAGSMSTSSRFSEQEKAAAVVGAIASSVDGLAENSLALDGSSLADGSSSVANTEPGSSKKAVMRRGLKQATWRRRGTSPPVTPVSEVLFVAVGAWRRPPLLPTAFVMRRAMAVVRQMTGH
mmetsp:Transcript_16225/g.35276  ORF Transcript_16225/g.35276 Transcript_16225/m.35276 type:complete len:677 (-) Transcript_16225:1640-3670(-)